MAFITVDELRSYPLPVTDKQWEKIDSLGPYQTQQIVDYATEHIKDYLERDIEELSYVERIQGNGRPKLMVNNYPVISVDSVERSDVHGYTSSYDPSEFLVDAKAGIIEWADKYRNHWFSNYLWTIEYTSGYPIIPGPIKHATALVSLQMLQPIFRGGTNFASIDLVDESNEAIVDLLEKYRRNRIG